MSYPCPRAAPKARWRKVIMMFSLSLMTFVLITAFSLRIFVEYVENR